jgi:hypothetical protein
MLVCLQAEHPAATMHSFKVLQNSTQRSADRGTRWQPFGAHVHDIRKRQIAPPNRVQLVGDTTVPMPGLFGNAYAIQLPVPNTAGYRDRAALLPAHGLSTLAPGVTNHPAAAFPSGPSPMLSCTIPASPMATAAAPYQILPGGPGGALGALAELLAQNASGLSSAAKATLSSQAELHVKRTGN